MKDIPDNNNVEDKERGDDSGLAAFSSEKPVENQKKKVKLRKKRNTWPVKILFITLLLSTTVSIVSEIASSKSGIVVALLILFFLIITSILFDGVGVSVTACDPAPLHAMAARKVVNAKTAIWLVKNAEKVNNICADVIGDICGIISGACGAAIVLKLSDFITSSAGNFILAIAVSSVTAAITVGGKAFVKSVAINKSQEFVMLTAKVISVFYKPNKKKKNKRKDKNASTGKTAENK